MYLAKCSTLFKASVNKSVTTDIMDFAEEDLEMSQFETKRGFEIRRPHSIVYGVKLVELVFINFYFKSSNLEMKKVYQPD